MSSLFRALPSSTTIASRTVASSSSSSRLARSLHILPPFDNLEKGKPVLGQRVGSRGSKSANVFLPPVVVQRLSKEYHQGLLDRLNEQVRGTKLESLKILDTITHTSNEPDQALTFNYASNALNNAFFLSGLRRDGNPSLNRDFILCLIKSFGSLRDFEEASARTIDSMTSSGWLWIVKRHGSGQPKIEFRVSYAAGTIVSPSRVQSGPFTGTAYAPPLPPPVASSFAAGKSAPEEKKRGRAWSPDRAPEPSRPTARYSGPATTDASYSFKGHVTPLACLSLHERSYLDHFGHGGRLEYFRQWLHALDYDKLMARVNASGPMIDYEAGEDASIELWQSSAESVTPAQVEAIDDALERAWQHDQDLIARGEEPIYKLARKLDMQYHPDARADHAYYNAWVSGTLTAEPEANEPAAAEESASAGETTESSGEAASAPAAEAAESAPTTAAEAEPASTPAASDSAAVVESSASEPASSAETAVDSSAPAEQGTAPKPSEGGSGSQSSP